MNDKNIIRLDAVDSTNNYARGLVARKETEEGTVVLALHQTRGRGIGLNSWESEKGKNLTFSVLLNPVFLAPSNQFFLSMVVSLGVFGFVASEVKDVKIKWPNDIYVSDRKIGGILIENTIMGDRITSAVAGVGLNINQEVFLSDAPNPVSLKMLTQHEYDLDVCLDQVRKNILRWYGILKAGDVKAISDAYISGLFRYKEWALYKKEDKTFKGKIIGIDRSGRLILKTDDGKTGLFGFKEIEYLITRREGMQGYPRGD